MLIRTDLDFLSGGEVFACNLLRPLSATDGQTLIVLDVARLIVLEKQKVSFAFFTLIGPKTLGEICIGSSNIPYRYL